MTDADRKVDMRAQADAAWQRGARHSMVVDDLLAGLAYDLAGLPGGEALLPALQQLEAAYCSEVEAYSEAARLLAEAAESCG
jgi:hypothetical protein